MTPPLEVVLGAAAAAPELRTPAVLVEEPIVEERIAEEQHTGAASAIAERRFEAEHLQLALTMGAAVIMAAVTVTRVINIAVEAATTVAEFIPAALW
jgi:predicted phage tail protein